MHFKLTQTAQMTKLTVSAISTISALLLCSTAVSAKEIIGAGATFPAPVYAKWAGAYKKETGIRLNYQSIGSGGGIKQIKAKTVDFGASDKPLKKEELDQNGLLQFPAIVGGVVPTVNLPGIKSGELSLDGDLLADIFMGKITKWNDPAIAKLNPKLPLPNLSIAPVHRADGSGTTFLFTDYLSKVSKEWKESIGTGKAVKWVGGIGGKGNAGVSNYVLTLKGSIGYVEYAFAKNNNLSVASLINKAGKIVQPDSAAFQAASASADWDAIPSMRVILTDQLGEQAWPISGASFILMHKTQEKPDNAHEVIKFFNWAFENGDDMANELGYVPLPDNVVKIIQKKLKTELKDSSGKSILR